MIIETTKEIVFGGVTAAAILGRRTTTRRLFLFASSRTFRECVHE
jgi:hypothetical protein